MNRQRIQGFFDKCTGCRICELVSSSVKLDEYRPRYAAIQILMKNEGLTCIPSTCVQCEDPHCMKNCIYDAIQPDKISQFSSYKKDLNTKLKDGERFASVTCRWRIRK